MHPIFADVRKEIELAANEARRLREAIGLYRKSAVLRAGPGRYLAIGGIASGIEKVYSGIERAFRYIASDLDGHLQEGGEWHKRLLMRMQTPIERKRPRVIGEKTFRLVDELRAFRHRERNLYASDLDIERMLEIASGIPAAIEAVRKDIASFEKELSSQHKPKPGVPSARARSDAKR
jgi:hypothetical protein